MPPSMLQSSGEIMQTTPLPRAAQSRYSPLRLSPPQGNTPGWAGGRGGGGSRSSSLRVSPCPNPLCARPWHLPWIPQ